MDTIYALGPSVLGLGAALVMAWYIWNRLRGASIVLLLWIIGGIALGQVPLFAGLPNWQDTDWSGFMIFGTLAFTPAALLLVVAFKVKKVKEALEKIPTSALVATQAYRVGGVFLIVAFLRGELPAEIGLVSGVMDVVVAVTAVLLALSLRRDETRSPRMVMAWAVLGLVDFGWASLMMFASFLGILDLTPDPVMMGNPPLLIISLFALPFGIFTSVYLILRMRSALSTGMLR